MAIRAVLTHRLLPILTEEGNLPKNLPIQFVGFGKQRIKWFLKAVEVRAKGGYGEGGNQLEREVPNLTTRHFADCEIGIAYQV